MQTLVNPKERIFNLANEMNDFQLLEIANYMQFIRQKNDDCGIDLMKMSESTLDFWNNKDDEVWDNV